MKVQAKAQKKKDEADANMWDYVVHQKIINKRRNRKLSLKPPDLVLQSFL